MRPLKRNILLNPGPATTTDAVKLAQVVPDICPREREFGDLMNGIAEDLVRIAGEDPAEYAAVLFGGSGTAVMEACVGSVVPPGGKLLVLVNGAYGTRMVEIARVHGIQTVVLECAPTRRPDLEAFASLLENDSKIEVVALVHHETTSGILNPLAEIGHIAKGFGKTVVVDTISSFAGVPLRVRDWGIDFLMSTANKCLQGMAGVAFVIASKEKLGRLASYPRRSYYLSLYDQWEHFVKHRQMRFTPPVQTLYALRKAIDELLEEGLEERWARYTLNWETLREGVERLGLRVATRKEEESHLLISISYPTDRAFDFDAVHDALYARGFTIYPGKMTEGSFRLANIGAITPRDIERFLTTLAEVLDNLGFSWFT